MGGASFEVCSCSSNVTLTWHSTKSYKNNQNIFDVLSSNILYNILKNLSIKYDFNSKDYYNLQIEIEKLVLEEYKLVFKNNLAISVGDVDLTFLN